MIKLTIMKKIRTSRGLIYLLDVEIIFFLINYNAKFAFVRNYIFCKMFEKWKKNIVGKRGKNIAFSDK